jgi:hypothetical protein
VASKDGPYDHTAKERRDQRQALARHYGRRGQSIIIGLWINVPVTLSATYSGWWWQAHYSVTGNPTDKVAVKFSLVGSPVHLVSVG